MTKKKDPKDLKKRGKKSTLERMGGLEGLEVLLNKFIKRMEKTAQNKEKPLFITHFLVENKLGWWWWSDQLKNNPEFAKTVDVMLTNLQHHFLGRAMEPPCPAVVSEDGTVISPSGGYNTGFVKLYANSVFNYAEKTENKHEVNHTGQITVAAEAKKREAALKSKT